MIERRMASRPYYRYTANRAAEFFNFIVGCAFGATIVLSVLFLSGGW